MAFPCLCPKIPFVKLPLSTCPTGIEEIIAEQDIKPSEMYQLKDGKISQMNDSLTIEHGSYIVFNEKLPDGQYSWNLRNILALLNKKHPGKNMKFIIIRSRQIEYLEIQLQKENTTEGTFVTGLRCSYCKNFRRCLYSVRMGNRHERTSS